MRSPGLSARLRSHPAAAAAVVPVVAVVAFGWAQRWTADDGFINFRVVEHLLAGNGPVFNDGERVEIATSPAWVLVLAVFSRLLFFAEIEWVSVLLGIAFAAGAMAMAAVGAARLHHGGDDGEGGRGALLPFGLLLFAALPPVWHFTTSGLEVSLGLFWLASSFAALARLATATAAADGRVPWKAAVLVGLGPLIRPDFAVFSAAFLLALVVLMGWGWRRVLAVGTAALALPAAYQVFRMGYYAALVPNTAFAKEAGRSHWSQGWHYFADFVETYVLWLPLLPVVAAAALGPRWTRRTGVVAGAVAGAAVVHWVYIVRVGGDFMHARMFLPGLFAALLPVAVVAIRRATALAGVAVLVWAVAAAAVLRPPYEDGAWGPHYIVNERGVYTNNAGRDHPVTFEDYLAYTWPRYSVAIRQAVEKGEAVVMVEEDSFLGGTAGVNRFPSDPEGPQVVAVFRFIGMLSYGAGTEAWVVDRLGLGDPIASRIRLEKRWRPGHEKELDPAWAVARFTAEDVVITDPGLADRVAAARRALHCGPVDRLLRATNEPLTARRFVANFKVALTTYGARISGDPRRDAQDFC